MMTTSTNYPASGDHCRIPIEQHFVSREICDERHGGVSRNVCALQLEMVDLRKSVEQKFDKLYYVLLAGVGILALNLALLVISMALKH